MRWTSAKWRTRSFLSPQSCPFRTHGVWTHSSGDDPKFRRVSETKKPPLLLKKISQYTSHLHSNTPPICIAVLVVPLGSKERETLSVLLPFVSQYASHLYCNTPPICIAVLLGTSWWLWSPGCSPKIAGRFHSRSVKLPRRVHGVPLKLPNSLGRFKSLRSQTAMFPTAISAKVSRDPELPETTPIPD